MLSRDPSAVLAGTGSPPPPSVTMLTDVDDIWPTRTIAQHRGPTAPMPPAGVSHASTAPSAAEPGSEPHSRVSSDSGKPGLRATSGIGTTVDDRFKDLFQAAHNRAPRCGPEGNEPRLWLTVSEASSVLSISKAVISNWATRGYIATIKSGGHNCHRLLHLNTILSFMQESMLRDGPEQEAPAHTPASPTQRRKPQPS